MKCDADIPALPGLSKASSLTLADAHGVPLFVGDSVRLLSVDSCAKGLPQEDQDNLFSYVNDLRTILEVDQWGGVWFAFNEKRKRFGAGFCLKPEEVLLEKPAKNKMKMNWPSIFGQKEPIRTDHQYEEKQI